MILPPNVLHCHASNSTAIFLERMRNETEIGTIPYNYIRTSSSNVYFQGVANVHLDF